MTDNPAEPAAATELADLRALLGRFSEARCVLECAVRSLEQWQDLDDDSGGRRGCDVEVVCLRHALKLLADIYDELDMAIARRSTRPRAGKRRKGRAESA